MAYKLLIALAALLGIFFFNRSKDTLLRVVLISLISGILISLIPFESTYQAGLWIYVIGLTLFALLVLLKPSAQTGLQKYLLIALGILIANHLIKLFHYPLAGMAGFACIISLAFIVFCIVTRFKSVREESGALIIIATDAFIQFSQSADWIWDKA